MPSSPALGGVRSSRHLDRPGSAFSFDLAAILGATYRIGRVTLGASAQLPATPICDAGQYHGTIHDQYIAGTTQFTGLTTGSGNFRAPPPVRFALGAGLELSRWIVELDESLDLAAPSAIASTVNVNATTVNNGTMAQSSTDTEFTLRTRPVLNTSIGAEYFVRPRFSVVGGISTNITAIPNLATANSLGTFLQSRTSEVDVSAGIGSYGEGSNLMFGLQLGYLWGDTLAVNPCYVLPNTWAVTGVEALRGMIILAGATDIRSVERAVEKVKDVVSGPTGPAPPPAPSK